jgi:3D (Asp-Asp-Asp) domain-containing protein
MKKITTKEIAIAIMIAISALLLLNHSAQAFRFEEISQMFRSESNSCDIVWSEEIKPVAKKTLYVTVTAYSSTPDQTDSTPFITASGSHVYDGTLAANFLPFGTKVRFPDYSGDKIYIVEDRMHKRFSDRVDIWFATREAALKFGKRRLKMEVL